MNVTCSFVSRASDTARDSPVLVFDVGGTTIRAGIYSAEPDSVVSWLRATTTSDWSSPGTPPHELFSGLVADLQTAGALLLEAPTVVSIGFPGPVAADGTLLAAPTVLGPGSHPLPLGRVLAEAWPDARVVVMNDVTAAGHALAHGDRDSFCVLTVGSGVGCKVFLDGRPVLGSAGRGGEIGHLRIDRSADANPCECGGTGHLGAIASGRGALITARRRASAYGMGAHRTCEELVAAFHAGDELADEVVGRSADALGACLAAIHTALGLERFVLTGGFALALGESYRRFVARAAAGDCWDLGQDWDRMVELDPLHGLSGLLGAGRHARKLLAPAPP